MAHAQKRQMGHQPQISQRGRLLSRQIAHDEWNEGHRILRHRGRSPEPAVRRWHTGMKN
jgi:hypothetical protein